ncbi:MAG TPA: EndoU domain-containing protein [Acetobacteraceae bacterium]|nr:EndoU domain-containing protein [Acetobacteraceae bacterium]
MSNADDENLPQIGRSILSAERRTHILDGDGRGGGGHGPGRGIPGKSEFPPNWTDEHVIDAIMSVADDISARREVTGSGRTVVAGTRDGIEIHVVIGRDGRTIVTAYPVNTSRNPLGRSAK